MRKIKWGVLGTAGIAKGCTIPGMQQAVNCELTAIAGRSLEKAERYRQEFGFRRAHGSYEELLADPEIEAVYIPLPNHLHFEWTVKALRAKKHVLCEKPLALNRAQAEEMVRTANENGVLLMEAFAYLHSPVIRALKQELGSGVIGDVIYMDAAFLTSDYDMSNIRMRRETCGGSLYDLGCYTTSLILTLMDEEPVKIQALGEFSDERIDKFTAGVMTFAGGARAAFTCGMVLATEQDFRVDRMLIHGTKGFIDCGAEFNQAGDIRYTVYADGKETVKTVFAPHNYKLEVEQLGRCISDGETPLVSNAFSLKNAGVLDRILKEIGY